MKFRSLKSILRLTTAAPVGNEQFSLRQYLESRAYIHPIDDVFSAESIFHVYAKRKLPKQQTQVQPIVDLEVKSSFSSAMSSGGHKTWCLKFFIADKKYDYHADDNAYMPQHQLVLQGKSREFFVVGGLSEDQVTRINTLWQQGLSIDAFFETLTRDYNDVKQGNRNAITGLLAGKMMIEEYLKTYVFKDSYPINLGGGPS